MTRSAGPQNLLSILPLLSLKGGSQKREGSGKIIHVRKIFFLLLSKNFIKAKLGVERDREVEYNHESALASAFKALPLVQLQAHLF